MLPTLPLLHLENGLGGDAVVSGLNQTVGAWRSVNAQDAAARVIRRLWSVEGSSC